MAKELLGARPPYELSRIIEEYHADGVTVLNFPSGSGKEHLTNFIPESIEFWRELRDDLESRNSEAYPVSLRTFLNYFDPEKNQDAWAVKGPGKYRSAVETFGQSPVSTKAHSELESFIIVDFHPSDEDEEFVDLVNETRQLIEDKLKDPRIRTNRAIEQLSNPQFWNELQKDLTALDQNRSAFSVFLLYFDPNNPESMKQQWMTNGKYREHYYALREHLFYERMRLANQGVEPGELPSTRTKDANKLFYDSAPSEVKIQLIARFPRDFGESALDIVDEENLLPESLKYVLNKVNLLGPDNQDDILDALSIYIGALREREGLPILPELKGLLEQVLEQLEPPELRKSSLSLEDILSGSENILGLIHESQTADQKISVPAKELLEALEKSYYLPLIKSLLYKPAALFWSIYQERIEQEGITPTEALVSFLEKFMNERMDTFVQTDEQKEVIGYLRGSVEFRAYRYFAEIVSFAPEIHYFAKVDNRGNPQHLFLHQIEAIKIFMELGGGILADEPGTGKTMILALTALNLFDRKELTSQGTKRVLVVGSKKVIGVWEDELAKHLETDEFDVANVNFTRQERESGSKMTLGQRIRMLEKILGSSAHDKQFILVNYDIYRSPAFRKILEKYNFDITEVDEAHNVKSRFFQSIGGEIASDGKSRVAQRTSNLYAFLLKNPDANVFLATSTPFVKELIEPLIMAHLVKPNIVTTEMISRLRLDVVGTSKALRKVMIRRRKEEIADLPPKETVFAPIELSSLSEEDQAVFISIVQKILAEGKGSFANFYSLLALEGQAKFPWLIDKVNEIIADGRNVVIFTPFVNAEKRLTASISTAAIAERLQQAGITSVGVLDGSLTENQVLNVEEEFLNKRIRVLVGNYLAAGESFTFNSPDNRATEVILFIAPNAISRYIQSVDRIHRIGQTEKVTTHIPFLTGDILGRLEGTYDERVVKRLIDEMRSFEAVVDGLFFVEQKDIYQTVVQGDKARIQIPVGFEVNRTGQTARTINRQLPSQEDVFSGRYKFSSGKTKEVSQTELDQVLTGSSQDSVIIDFGRIWYPQERMIYESGMEDRSAEGIYFTQIKDHPILSRTQEGIIFEYLRTGKSSEDLAKDDFFFSSGFPKEADKLRVLIENSSSIRDVIVKCNQRLVAAIAHKYMGLPLMDKIQEGNIGLLIAMEKFDVEKGTKFSTYATWWIRQAMTRAAMDTGRPIRVPVHMEEGVRTAAHLAYQFQAEQGRPPQIGELRGLLISKKGYGNGAANSVIRTLQSGALMVSSLNKVVGSDEASEIGDFIPDRGLGVEETALDNLEDLELREEVEKALAKLDKKRAEVIRQRFGLDNGRERTLQEVGDNLGGLTRERVRQIEESGIEDLRRDYRLKTVWDNNMPTFAYRVSAEEAALRMGLLDTEQDKLEKRQEKNKRNRARRQTSQGAARVFNLSDRPSQTDNINEIQRVIEVAKAEPEVWDQLAERERGILPVYYRSNSDRESLKDRLGAIFGLSVPELEVVVDGAIERISQLVRVNSVQNSNHRQRVRVRYNSPPLTLQEAEVLDDRVKAVLTFDDSLTNEEIAKRLRVPIDRVSDSLERVKLSKAGSNGTGKPGSTRNNGFVRPEPIDPAFLADVQKLRMQSLSYAEISEKLGADPIDVFKAVRSLVRDGRIPQLQFSFKK